MSRIENLCYQKYMFESAESEMRWSGSVHRSSGPLVLNELKALLIEAGADATNFEDLVPRSVYRVEMLDKPLKRFLGGGEMGNYDIGLYREAISRVRTKFRSYSKVKPMTIEQVAQRMDLTKNSGLPTMLKKEADYEGAITRAHQCVAGKCPPPMVIFHRGKNLEEVRPVSCLPFEWHLVEGMFFYPVQEVFIRFNNPYYVGRTRASVACAINHMRYGAERLLAMDYSSFDGSISAKLIGDAFNIIRDQLNLSKKEHLLLDRVATYFTTGPMLLPDGNVVYGRRHGVPSGSMFTQMIDTLVNSICIEYLALRLNLSIGRYLVVGDDSIVSIRSGHCKLTDCATILKELGINLNQVKSALHRPDDPRITFLGHYGTAASSRDVRETFRKIVTPERWIQGLGSVNQSERYRAYAAIIRGHMIDNRIAFPVLSRVLEVLEGFRDKIYVGDSWKLYTAAWKTAPNSVEIGRARWDRTFRSFKGQLNKGFVAGVLMLT